MKSKTKICISVVALVVVFAAAFVLVLSNGNITKNKSFKSEVVVHQEKPMKLIDLEIFPNDTIINNGTKSWSGEGIAEKYLRKWYSPQSMDQFYSLFLDGNEPVILDEDNFMNRVKSRVDSRDYIVLKSKATVSLESKLYYFIKYYEYQDGVIYGSNVKILTSNGDEKDEYYFVKAGFVFNDYRDFFWRTETWGYAYLLYDDKTVLKGLKRDVVEMITDIRDRCLTPSGEFCLKPFLEEVDRIRGSGTPEERSALKHLMIQPLDAE